MSLNQDKIQAFYSGGGEDSRQSQSRSHGVEFYYTEKILRPYINKTSKIAEIGCATGYYAMRFANLCDSYLGIDICPENIEIFRRKIADNRLCNVTAEFSDATLLTGLPDGAFDIVLCLGPMYHLSRPERLKAFSECYRIANKGAVLAFAYINRIGAYAGACCNDKWRDIYPNPRTNRFVFDLSTDDEKPDLFYFTSPEEMEEDALSHRLTILENRGLDFFFAANAIDAMSDEQYQCYLELSDKMSESPSCVGLANHALLVTKKQ
jgi:SAM-dependent methyltransferase